MNIVEKVEQYGCSVYSLNGFPGDNNWDWDRKALDRLRDQVKQLDDQRGYVLSLNAFQLKAKKILIDAGFKVMGVTYTAHIDGNAHGIKQWKEDFAAGKLNKDTIFLMGRGFWAIKKQKKGKRADK